MAITTTILTRTVFGNRDVVIGKSVVSGGSSGGDIETGLGSIDAMFAVAAGSDEQGIALNETFPLASGDVTLVNEDANSTTYWLAIGNW